MASKWLAKLGFGDSNAKSTGVSDSGALSAAQAAGAQAAAQTAGASAGAPHSATENAVSDVQTAVTASIVVPGPSYGSFQDEPHDATKTLADIIDDGMQQMSLAANWLFTDTVFGTPQTGEWSVDRAVSDFVKTHPHISGMCRIVRTAPGRYLINGNAVQVLLGEEDAKGQCAIHVLDSAGQTIPLEDFLRSVPQPGTPMKQPRAKAAPGPPGRLGVPSRPRPIPGTLEALSAIDELPSTCGVRSDVYDDAPPEIRARAEIGSELPDTMRGVVLIDTEVPFWDPKMAGGALARTFSATIPGKGDGAAPAHHVFVSEVFLAKPLQEAARVRLNMELRTLGASLRAASPLLSPPLGAVRPPLPAGGAPHGPVPLWIVGAGRLLPEGLQPLQRVLDGTFNLAERVYIAQAVAQAVASLHAAGFCHGGLGSRCVHVLTGTAAKEGLQVRVADAGVVPALRQVGIESAGDRIALGMCYARYLAPEGWDAKNPMSGFSAASDVWALALLVAECLGLGVPHAECSTPHKLGEKILPRPGYNPKPDVLLNNCQALGRFPRLAALLASSLDVNLEKRPNAKLIAESIGGIGSKMFAQAAPTSLAAPPFEGQGDESVASTSSGGTRVPPETGSSSRSPQGTNVELTPGRPVPVEVAPGIKVHGRLPQSHSFGVPGDADNPVAPASAPARSAPVPPTGQVAACQGQFPTHPQQQACVPHQGVQPLQHTWPQQAQPSPVLVTAPKSQPHVRAPPPEPQGQRPASAPTVSNQQQNVWKAPGQQMQRGSGAPMVPSQQPSGPSPQRPPSATTVPNHQAHAWSLPGASAQPAGPRPVRRANV